MHARPGDDNLRDEDIRGVVDPRRADKNARWAI